MSGILKKKPLRSSLRELQPRPPNFNDERFTDEDENYTFLPLNVCRICLAMNVKMYDMTKNNLNVKYEKVTGLEILSDDKLPQKLCWECVARLSTANKLRKTALISRKILLDKIKGDRFITETHIKQIHGDQLTQKSSLVTHIHKPNTSYLHIIEYEKESDDDNSNCHNNDSEIIDVDTDDEEEIASSLFGRNKRKFYINEQNMSKNFADKKMDTGNLKITQERSLQGEEVVESKDNENECFDNKVCILSNELIYPINGEIVNPKLEVVLIDDEETDSKFIYDSEEISQNILDTTVINTNSTNENPINISTMDSRPIDSTPLNTSNIDAINTTKIDERSICAGLLNTIATDTNTIDVDFEVSIKVEDDYEITVVNLQENSAEKHVKQKAVYNNTSNLGSKRKRKSGKRLNYFCKKLRMEVKIILHDIAKDPAYEEFLKNRKTVFYEKK